MHLSHGRIIHTMNNLTPLVINKIYIYTYNKQNAFNYIMQVKESKEILYNLVYIW